MSQDFRAGVSAAVPRSFGYWVVMDTAAMAILIGVVVVFIAGGLVWAFFADRKRNEDVAHDTERLDPDPTRPPVDPSNRHGG